MFTFYLFSIVHGAFGRFGLECIWLYTERECVSKERTNEWQEKRQTMIYVFLRYAIRE